MEFQITPASPGATVFMLGLALLMAVLAIGFAWLAVSATRPSVVLGDSALTLKAPLYGRSIELSRVRLEEARVVNLESGTELRPKIRTNGIGLPGLGIGWFRLTSGEKALVAMSARDRVLYVPTDEGYSLLLSLERPEAFLEQATRMKKGS
ncbi:MAG: PH domain-containing protein [Candidatus Palauibacterales bacterium]|jgi:Bacterial PH domain|nr:PH domain-containing protein [Candidatus Palauibacterales bacterium]MDP2483615.1 PH domain-containing protein [Candidatus Palauibacterales bacterium]